ncbi:MULTISPECIES: glutathione S-transferase family protein [Burkholderia cepacia complex]|uniref:Glutathione S-transferase domain n=1 Tax=Burkholderia orbicola (strain MC0-3) TaxID=406425 RepID=B1KBZ0_BURO0|nr:MULTISPECIES: glutathione S-transferase [Burkholderia cepacia complex]ACA95737.1 Glutathione S-transferase domain [Burkholderia orbicola MC0-3]MBR8154673.1 glutathione S-transferase [Burkholderia cenocepacia]MCA8082598.1 glutathione S-transferase [Burkholderia cenocepacia]HEB3530964.1 glutathione S-transferase [Burkholderia cenocepacia]
MLTVWGRRNAFNVQKVMWLVDELALAHRHVPAGGRFGVLDTPEFLAMNPHGRIPVIDDDGTVVWESHSILRYLAARHGRPGFWRDDPAEQSRADRWMDWAQTTLQPAFLNGVFRDYYRTPPGQRDTVRVEQSIAQCAQYFRVLDTVLAGQPFLAGDAITLADIAAGTHLYRYFELDIARPDVPHVVAWYERLKARPAYRTNVMIPFDDLRGKLG